MMATVAIKAGEQIWNTYADPPNSDLLRRYGHVDETNAEDLVEIGMESLIDLIAGDNVDLNHELKNVRAEWLLDAGLEE